MSNTSITHDTDNTVAPTTGRYYVGQKLIGIQFLDGKDRMPVSVRAPLLYDDVQPTEILIEEFTVTEHHKVPSEWDEEPITDEMLKYDGYLLQASSGLTYRNQYPYASYGQISGVGDRVFKFKEEKGETIESLIEKGVVSYSFKLITDPISSIYEALEHEDVPEEKKEQLRILLNNIEAVFLAKFPELEIRYVPITWQNADGTTEVCADIKHAEIFDKALQSL